MRIIRTKNRAVFALPGIAILGAAIGAVAALLMAPCSGDRTRRKVFRNSEKVAGRLIGHGREAVERCGDFLRTQRGIALARLH